MSLAEALVALAQRAGVPVHIPDDARGVCCGVPFSSKGFAEAHRPHREPRHRAVLGVERRRRPAGGGGHLPLHLRPEGLPPLPDQENQARFDKLTILDTVAFAHDVLLPRLTVKRKLGSVALHPVCSLTKMNLVPKLEAIAKACAERVVIPRDAGCCGFAGDRGLPLPGAHRLRHEARGRRGELQGASTGTTPAAAPARWASPGPRGTSTGASSTCWKPPAGNLA